MIMYVSKITTKIKNKTNNLNREISKMSNTESNDPSNPSIHLMLKSIVISNIWYTCYIHFFLRLYRRINHYLMPE